MESSQKYWDKRLKFFKEFFNTGLSYDEYLSGSPPNHAERWRAFEQKIALGADQLQVLSGFTRKMNVLVMSGVWCGDCARQGPMLRRIEQACPVITFRYLDNRQNPLLQEELRINGAEKVPVVVVLSEDFFELSRFGDRHLGVYRKKAKQELGPACDPGIVAPATGDMDTECQEWVSYFERVQLILRLSPLLRQRYQD